MDEDKFEENVENDDDFTEDIVPSAGFGFEERIGWLYSLQPCELFDEERRRFVSALDLYFIGDIDLPNHLSGIQHTFIRLRFHDINDSMKAYKELQPIVKRNIECEKKQQSHPELVVLKRTISSNSTSDLIVDGLSNANVAEKQIDGIIELREFDVLYHIRVCIDLKINVGLWYGVLDLIEQPKPIIFASDIECTKIPLKFPSVASDHIMMISYMIDTQGYLIINCEIISQDMDDFEYTPKKEYPGHFHVFNEPNEFELIKHFFLIILLMLNLIY
ncbi:unnamed protein product [Rotaria sordida]|uniref:DNA polymerase epsilon catalytic subunit n=1 Tax=Rotaria sordida TaxID=392033 RepID=A0A819X594_9BILA|nr:unnamed protein product [Rotaria sordida]